jgi:hypothetical protein
MKRLLLALSILVFLAVPAMADWQVTVSGWIMSTGPDLAHEDVLMDGVAQCSDILPADNKACVFNIVTKTNQAIVIRSYDGLANFADFALGNIGSGPNPASGGSVTVIWQ